MLAGITPGGALLGLVIVVTAAWAAEEACTNSGGLAIDGAESTFMAGSADKDSNDKASIEGDTMKFPHNSGYSLMKSCRKEWDPKEFKVLQLLGRKLSFLVDLSKAGCACNVAFYLIQAPARAPSGNFSKGECAWSPYYCDANRVCGQWCPELDIMEANNRVFSSTLHSCNPPDANGHYNNCDKGGCGQNTKDLGYPAYGPGSSFTIDTTKPFEVVSDFQGSEKSFTGFVTKLRQMEGEKEKVVILDHAACGANVGWMTAAMATGMSLRVTYWGTDAQTMAWLDSPPCGGEACSGETAGPAVISNLRIVPPIDPEPHPETSPPPSPPPRRETTPEPEAPPPPTLPSAFSIAFAGWEQALVLSGIVAMLLAACCAGVAIGRKTAKPAAETGDVPTRSLSTGSMGLLSRKSSRLLRLAESGGVSSASLAED